MSERKVDINDYRAVLAGASRMRELARAQAWELVSETARDVTALTDTLRRCSPMSLPDAATRRERIEILTQIVRIDAEIRQLREPWLARLDNLLAPSTARRNPAPAAPGESPRN